MMIIVMIIIQFKWRMRIVQIYYLAANDFCNSLDNFDFCLTLKPQINRTKGTTPSTAPSKPARVLAQR